MPVIEIEGREIVSADLGEMPARVNRAMVRAMNRALGSGRTVMVRNIASDTGLKSKDVRDALPLREASLAKPSGEFGASLKRIPLMKFGARQTKRGVTYRNPGAGGRQFIPGAFIATMSNGHTDVFLRKGKKRLPIQAKRGPSLGKVFEKFRPLGVARVQEAFETNFDHEFEFERSQGANAN